MYRIGSRVMVAKENDNENYDSFRDKILIVTHVARNRNEHRGYDDTMKGMALYDFKTEDNEHVPYSLYEYELESAKKRGI